MMETQSQDCPLCKTVAEYYRVEKGNLKYFKCPTCTYFQISDRAEELILDAPQQWHDELSEKAKNTPEEHLLVITVPSAANATENAEVKFAAEYQLKSSLSL